MPSDDHDILAIVTTNLTADDDKIPPLLTTSPVQSLSPTKAGGLLSPHSPAAGPRGSLDSPALITTDDGVVPPSPTLSSRSSVHFSSSLALRDNNPQLRSPSSFATTISDTTEADHTARQDEELYHVKSNATSVTTRVGSRSASRAKRDTADSDTATAISVRPRRKKGASAEDTDSTPFRFRSNDLAMMLDPKNLDTLEHMDGLEGRSFAGTEVAQEASDIILMDDIFAKVITWGRCVSDAVRKFLQFPFSTIVTAVVITFVSAPASVEKSSVLSAVQPFCINIIAGTFAAYAATKPLLNRKPDKKIAPLFSVEMCKRILFQSTYQFIITRIFHFAVRGILPADTDLMVQIPIFCVVVFAQISDSVNSRHLDRKLNIFEGMTKNWYFITDGQNLTGYVIQDGHYPFARGGYSNVYKGTFIRSDGHKIPVAMKMISPREGTDEALTFRRIKREASIWAPLEHKNLVPFFGVCDDITPYPVLISPLYKLGDVGAFLRKNPAANRPDIVLGVASGLEYLHDHGIVHGDLKPSNVLVDEQFVPHICDFGISKILNRPGFTTTSLGTFAYMAPELFLVVGSGEQEGTVPSTTKQSDVYSFALLALEILTSKPPEGRPARPFVTTQEALSELRVNWTDYKDKVTGETWSVLDRCLAFTPTVRPTISGVRQQLSAAFH